MKIAKCFSWIVVLSLMISGISANAKTNDRSSELPLTTNGAQSPEAKAFLQKFAAAGYRFTPAIRDAYLTYIEQETQKELAAKNITLPPDFLAWIKSDPIVFKTVYGARANPLNTLLWLRSLEMDLGKEIVREKYPQFALASAVANGDNGDYELSPRPPLALKIPTAQPNAPVNTKDPSRKLDEDDWIVNFFKDHPKIEGEVAGGMKKELAGWFIDSSLLATPEPTNKKQKNEPLTVLRPLIPADVLESRPLQIEFNNYMKAKGFAVNIDCGDHLIFPAMKERMSKSDPHYKGLIEAYRLFRDAFEKKGLLATRDAAATPAERFAYLVRNDETKLSPEQETLLKKHGLPRYPLNASWTISTMLAEDATPLRERDDLWKRFLANSELHTYGEYIGPIAQNFDLQSARRLSPFPYAYGSVEMKLKDGGVCGTMAAIEVSTCTMLGIPAATAGQPGHCALVYFTQNEATGKYECLGKQFVTAGDEGTHPSTHWVFGDIDQRRDMIYSQSVCWATNAGLSSFLDTMIAYDIYRMMPQSDRAKYGTQFISDALAENPYNILLAQAGLEDAPTAKEMFALLTTISTLAEKDAALAGADIRLPRKDVVQTGAELYERAAEKFANNHLAKIPADPAFAQAIDQLKTELQNPAALTPADKKAAGKALE